MARPKRITKRKRRKSPRGREALTDTQERAVPRENQYANQAKGTKEKGGRIAKRRNRGGTASTHRLSANWWRTTSFAWVAPAMLLLFLYAFWPTHTYLEETWRSEPDYSHGYLVLPFALVIAWVRRDLFPGLTQEADFRAFILVGVGCFLRVLSALSFFEFADGYAIVLMLSGLVWLCLGWPAFVWALPSLGFLFLMIPLPFRIETALSWQLQGVATNLSTVLLRLIGVPVVMEGRTIWIGDTQLFVEKACSGLRIFVGMFAMSYFLAASTRRHWTDRLVILLAAVPAALVVNASRIVAIGYLTEWLPNVFDRKMIHDWSGIVMIPVAGLLLFLAKVYWEKLYRPVVIVSPTDSIKQAKKDLGVS